MSARKRQSSVNERGAKSKCPSYGAEKGIRAIWTACPLREVCIFKGYCIVSRNDDLDRQIKARKERTREFFRNNKYSPCGIPGRIR